MSSMEPLRTSPYSNDIKWRIVYEKEGLGFSNLKVARNLHIDVSTVKRVINKFRSTGSVQKSTPCTRSSPKLTAVLQYYIMDLVITNPGIYLHEIQAKVTENYLVNVNCSTICRFLHKSGFSHQKMQIVANQRNELQRLGHCLDVSLYKAHSLIFVDETGCDQQDLIRRNGYSIKGKPLQSSQLLVRGRHISVIAAILMKGLLDLKICKEGVGSDTFIEFVRENLSIHLHPFDGDNPHSVVC